MEDLISVIIPVYNVEKYLRRCIDSIINQTYKNLEIILVDDGSTDSSGAICDEYASKDGRIKVIHKENGGVSLARNKGIEISKGKYIAFIDADDYVKKDYFETLYSNAIKNNADISFCDCIEVYNGVEIDRFHSCEINAERVCYDEYIKDYLDKKMFYGYVVWGSIIRHKTIENHRFMPFTRGEDTVYMMTLFADNPKSVLSKYQGYYYIRNEDSVTMITDSANPDTALQYINIANTIYENMGECSEDTKKRVCNDYMHKIYSALSKLIKNHDKSLYINKIGYLNKHIDKVFKEKCVRPKYRLFIGIYRSCPVLYWYMMNILMKIKERI